MKAHSFLVAIFLLAIAHLVRATQADDTTITITGQNAGATPFISQLTLSASDTTVIKSIQFSIATKTGAFSRPLSGTFSADYLLSRGDIVPPNQIFLPVYGLYDGFDNTVTLTYTFLDNSSKQDSTTITTAAFDDTACGFKEGTVLQARSGSATLSYDYIFIRSNCGTYSPVVLDSDGALRWVSPLAAQNSLAASSGYFDGAVYECLGSMLNRVDLDGTITVLGDYASDGVINFHHNIDLGKNGLLLEADTSTQDESTILEVGFDGTLLKTWHMSDIISAAMTAGGDDPSQFVYPSPTDWFHNNAATYNRGDDSLVISSRENFVISIDYDTGAIKWILGDQTKHWFQFPSLAAFAISLTGNSLPPIGQHAVSMTFDQNLLLLDDGFWSQFQQPPGINRTYSTPRKFRLGLTEQTAGNTGTATEVWNFEMNQSVYSPICSSVYEDAPYNYLVDYAFVNGSFTTGEALGQLLGLDAQGNIAFYYQYNALFCNQAYNSLPMHLESSKFPTIAQRPLNLSARGNVSTGANALIGGFIVNGDVAKKLALRALGPSLSGSGLSGVLADPVLTVFDSTGAVVATNDDWQSDPGAGELTDDGLAPTDPAESATVQSLDPGAYTVEVTSKDGSSGIGLVEAYDLEPETTSRLANISTRGLVGTGDNALITGFILGDVEHTDIVVRALGPSLATAGVTGTLLDPLLTVYDSNGTSVAVNNNWQDDPNQIFVKQNGLAPTVQYESALFLHLPAGAYTAVVVGAAGGSGIGLVELYNLDLPSE